MKNSVVILAGGVSRRMNSDIPKQFLEINGKPIIVYTVENFQKNPQISEIVIVCVSDWIPLMEEIVRKYKLNKVKGIIEGGVTAHDSTRNGLYALEDALQEDDFVIIHDAARPILPQKAIDSMLEVAHKHGNASLAIPCHETVIFTDDQLSGDKELPRNTIMRVQTPQAYNYALIRDLYRQADRDNIHDIIYADLVAIHYGVKVFFSKGFTNNIKITRKEDLALTKSLMGFTEEELYSM